MLPVSPALPPDLFVAKHYDCDLPCLRYHQRLYQYCHTALLRTTQQMIEYHFSLDRDGSLPGGKGVNFELVQAHIVARHGDRSPVHTYKVGSPVFYDCGLQDNGDGSRWTRLRDFPRPRKVEFGNQTIYYAKQSIFPGASSKHCGVGKLTRTGYYQHKALGAQMWKMYSKALGLHNLTGEMFGRSVYVQSTDLTRTMHSAAAFMLGFVPDRQSLRKHIVIHMSPGDRLEAPPPGVTPILPSCTHYKAFHNQEVRESDFFEIERTKYHPLFERLSRMFRLDVDNLPLVTKVFDSVRTRGCHDSNNPLPCYEDDCIDYNFANSLFDFSDWDFTTYNSLPISSFVGSLPFLRHSLLGLMQKLISGERRTKFILSTSHDSHMTELLQALGVKLDKTMPYASRIVFELWKAKDVVVADKSAYYIRVLFNGSPITHRLAPSRTDSELLAYSEFEQYLTTGSYRDLQSYNKACSNQS